MSAIIQCRGVTKIYRQGAVDVPALRGVDLDIEAGDFATLSGPVRFGQDHAAQPDRRARPADRRRHHRRGPADHRAWPAAQLADLRLNKIGFVFQTYSLVPVLSAVENVEFILRLLGPPRGRAAGARPRSAARGRPRRARGSPALRELSGGQQQRVAVARALAPEAGDRAGRRADRQSRLQERRGADRADGRLNAASGITFLIATHDARVIAHSRRRIEMADGRITADERQRVPAGA